MERKYTAHDNSEPPNLESKPKLNEYGKFISSYPCPSDGGKVRFEFENNSIDIPSANATAIYKTSVVLRSYHLDDRLSPEEFIQANLVYDTENAGHGKIIATAIFALFTFTLACFVFAFNLATTGYGEYIFAVIILWLSFIVLVAIIPIQMPQRYEIPAKMAQAVVELRRKNTKPEDGLNCYVNDPN
ncbi:hypothetical protein [Rothia sp. LK2492]|uniref:hypothetical protein n=1 Tax=Rothia sp. LK2492 TaxID=3114370 RepID=UPI0034CE53E0